VRSYGRFCIHGKDTSTHSCSLGIPTGNKQPNIDRIYVVDESMGSLSVLCVFQTMKNAPDEFRLEGGKIHYLHTIIVFKSSRMTGEGVLALNLASGRRTRALRACEP
jgi:hypothetical protein